MIARAGLFALACAACGGAAPKTDAPMAVPAATAKDGALPTAWAPIDEPTFSARMPAGFERRDAGGEHVATANKDGVAYMIRWSTVGPEAEGEQDRVFDAASAEFFRSCRGARIRLVHADTLEHKTVTVDGTCGTDKAAMGQLHLRGRNLVQLYIVMDGGGERGNRGGQADTDELRGFFRAFRVKSS